MNGAIAWFARNHVAANLLMFAIVAAGLISAPRIKQSVFPDIDTKLISVTVVYPGASAEEVEKSITIRLEEEISAVEGIKAMRSSANEGATNVTIELEVSADTAKALDDIETRVDSIDTFPQEAEEPVVKEVLFRTGVLEIAIYGDADERTLKHLGQRVRDDIASLPGISQVELLATRPFEISIEVSEAVLQSHGLRFDDIVTAVRRSSIDVPGGSVKTAAGEILLRIDGQGYRGSDFERIALVAGQDGSRVEVGDVATVVDGFEETDKVALFDGKPAVFVQVYRAGDQRALEIAARVHRYLDEARSRMPAGVALTVWDDDSKYLGDRIDMMLSNARTGFVLVLVLLAIFLKLRVALWVALGVPVAVAGALALMSPLGIDINVLTVFAFIMALGILVDDAIVTGENIYTHQERDPSDPLGTAIRGAQEVAVPVVFGVLTTIAAFAPFMLIQGRVRFMATGIGGVMMVALAFSLVESKFVLPSHLARISNSQAPPRFEVSRRWAAFQAEVSKRLRRFVQEVYGPAVQCCIEWRYLTAAVSFGIFAVCLSMQLSGHVKSRMMPSMQADSVFARLTMPLGTPAWQTADAVARLEAAGLALREQLEAERLEGEPPAVNHVLSVVGEHVGFGAPGRPGIGQSHLGEVVMDLAPAELRHTDSKQIEDRWREMAGAIAGVEELTFVGEFHRFGNPIDIELRGDDTQELREAALELSTALSQYPGVFDIRDSYRDGKLELKLRILPSAEALGISLQDVGRQVRQAFYGAEVQRVQRGRDEVRVMVRYPADERRSLVDLENMRIRLSDGTALPLLSVAQVDLARGASSLFRRDQARVVNVTANLDRGVANADEIMADVGSNVLPGILQAHPGLHHAYRGEQEESRQARADLRLGFYVALLSIFILLAIPLRSYLQAIVIMLAIPFGYVGALLGHWLTGNEMSFLSIIGVMACAGVVVNDSLVLVTFLNQLREEGMSLREAAVRAGQVRFRAIMLTSLTTFAGLTPIMLERSTQAQVVIPMAISLAFGVLVATLFTLLLIPSAILIVEDLREVVRRIWSGAVGGLVAR